MSSDQATRGFLPPTTTTHELHPQPPSPTANSLRHRLGFTALPLPQTPPTTTTTNSCPPSHLATALDRAAYNICDAVAAAAATTGDAHNPIRRTKSDITSYAYNHNPRTTTTARRNPLHRTVSDATAVPPPPPPPPRTRNMVPESLNWEESPQIKRLRKMKEMATEIEQRFLEFRREFESESEVTQENVEDDKPSEVIVDQEEAQEECVGFKQLDEGQEECVGFKRLDDGGIRIQMRCSCRKRFEILRNNIGCFYRLI